MKTDIAHSAAAEQPSTASVLGTDGQLVPKSTTHLAYLDGLRGLLALFVVALHIWNWNTVGREYPPGTFRFLTAWIGFGELAVVGFIVLSGYCLMLPVARNKGYLRGTTGSFFWRRARRILPTYLAAVLICVLLIRFVIGHATGTGWDRSINIKWSDLLIHLAMMQDLIHPGKINGVFWSVAVEWRIYFLFPLIVWAWRKRSGPLVAYGLSLGIVFLAYIIREHHNISKAVYFPVLFLAGVASASISEIECGSAVISLVIALATLSSAAVVALGMRCDRTLLLSNPFFDCLAAFAFACWLIVLRKADRSIVRNVLSWRPLVGVGVFSYSLYLMHAPCVQIAWQYVVHPLHVGDAMGFVLLGASAIPLSIGVSFAFYWVFERPFVSSRSSSGIQAWLRGLRTYFQRPPGELQVENHSPELAGSFFVERPDEDRAGALT